MQTVLSEHKLNNHFNMLKFLNCPSNDCTFGKYALFAYFLLQNHVDKRIIYVICLSNWFMFQYVVCGELKKIAKTSHLYTFTKWKTSTQRRFLEERLPSEDVLGRWKLICNWSVHRERMDFTWRICVWISFCAQTNQQLKPIERGSKVIYN